MRCTHGPRPCSISKPIAARSAACRPLVILQEPAAKRIKLARWPRRTVQFAGVVTLGLACASCASTRHAKPAAAAPRPALADHHYLEARAWWTNKAERAAGRLLEAATLFLHEAAAKTAGASQSVIDDAHQLSKKLVANETVSASKVDKQLGALAAELHKLAPS